MKNQVPRQAAADGPTRMLRLILLLSISDFYKAVPTPDGELCVIPGRDPRLPAMYKLSSHPLLYGVKGVRAVYVYFQDTCLEKMLEFWSFVNKQVFPDGTEAGVKAAGMLQ